MNFIQNEKSRYFSEIFHEPPLSEKYRYLEFFWSVFLHIWIEHGEIQSIPNYSVQMWENADPKNSQYGHFLQRARNFGYYQKMISSYQDSVTQNPYLGYVYKKHCLVKFPKILRKTLLEAVSLELYRDTCRYRCLQQNFLKFFWTLANVYLFKFNNASTEKS